MSVITLISDWFKNDFYIAATKGRILSLCPDQTIVDISHSITTFNTAQAAFVLRNAYPNFPAGTIHLIFVNTESSPDKPSLIVKAHEQFFIGTDNGIFSLILSDNHDKIIQINIEKRTSHSAIELFTKTACQLAKGAKMEELGEVIDTFNQKIPLRPTIENLTLTGSVIYIDSYNNAITNITKDLFEKIRQQRKFEIFIQSKHYKVSRISSFYHEVPVGELLALFNSVGLLEIAINNGNAAGLLNLDVNSSVRIVFSD